HYIASDHISTEAAAATAASLTSNSNPESTSSPSTSASTSSPLSSPGHGNPEGEISSNNHTSGDSIHPSSSSSPPPDIISPYEHHCMPPYSVLVSFVLPVYGTSDLTTPSAIHKVTTLLPLPHVSL